MNDREKKSLDELLDEGEAKDWLFRAERDMFPKMKASMLSMVVNSAPDAKLALEIGAAILFDKPLVVVALKGQTVPQNLRRIASEVVEIDNYQSPEGQAKVRAAIERELAKLKANAR